MRWQLGRRSDNVEDARGSGGGVGLGGLSAGGVLLAVVASYFLGIDPMQILGIMTQAGEMGVNDWQNSCKGNWSRDLAYCISTGTVPEVRRTWERELLKYYLEELARAGGPRLGFEDAWRNYRQQLFAALA